MARHGKSNPIFRGPVTYYVFVCFCFFIIYLLRIFLNCAFYAFYKENQGLELPRETRLAKLMRLLEVSKKMHVGNVEISTKAISGVHFQSKSQLEKSR